MDKVSKNAFIFCSIYGDAFCPSAAASFGLVWRNLARVAAVSTVGSFIIVLGKLVVSFLTAGIAAFVMVKTSYGVDLSSPLLPGVVILLLAYIISSLFMIIYETAIDTIFLCFLIDEVRTQRHCQCFLLNGLSCRRTTRAETCWRRPSCRRSSTNMRLPARRSPIALEAVVSVPTTCRVDAGGRAGVFLRIRNPQLLACVQCGLC